MVSADELLDGAGATPAAGPARMPGPADAVLDTQPKKGGDQHTPGIMDAVRAVGPLKFAEVVGKMAFAPDQGKKLPRFPDGMSNETTMVPLPGGMMVPYNPAVVAGTWNAMAPALDSIHSPAGLLMGTTGGLGMEALSLAKASPVAAATLMGMKGAFSALQVPGTIEAAKEWKTVMADPKATLQQKVEANMKVVVSGVGVLLPWLARVEATNPEVLKNLKDKPITEAPRVLQEASLEAENPQQKAVLMHTAEALHDAAPTEKVQAPVEEPPAVPPDQTKTEQAPEPPEQPEKLIGIKNVARDEAAEKLGDEKPEHGEATSDEAEQAKAQAKLDEDPEAGAKVIDSLAKKMASGKPATVSTGDVFLASHEMVRATNEREAAQSALEQARQANDPVAIQDADQRVARARDNYTKVANVVTKFGTEQAQAFRARAVMFKEDFSLASMEHQLAAATKDGKLTPEQEGFVGRIQKSFVKTREQLEAHEAQRLAAAKRRAEIAAEEVGAKLQRGDLSPNPKPEPVKPDAELERLQAAHERVKQEFQEAVVRARLEQRTPFEKLQDLAVKWRRGFALSGPVTLAKLTAASAFRMVSTPLEDAVGALYGTLPVVREYAKGAPIEGGFNSRALAKAYSEAWSKGLRDAYQTLKTGKSDLDVLFGKGKDGAVGEGDVIDHSIIDHIGNIHGALKAPLKRFTYTLAMEKQFDWAVRTGADAGNPVVQVAMSNRAYRKAQANLFLQDNVFNDAMSAALGTVEHSKTAPGLGKAVGTAARIAMPIRKVPTNNMGEAIEYGTGLATGSWKIAKAARAGAEKLTAEQKDVIMRNLKKGTLGAGGLAMLLGYFHGKKDPIQFGGFYQKGEKRKAGDVPAGAVRVFGEDVPSFLLDHPFFQTMQIGTTALRVATSKIRKGDRDAAGWTTGLGAAAMGAIDETPFGREDVELGQIIGGDPSERQYRWGEFVRGLVVPQAVDFAAKKGDTDSRGKPIQRKATTVGEHIEESIPGLRETLPKRKIDQSNR